MNFAYIFLFSFFFVSCSHGTHQTHISKASSSSLKKWNIERQNLSHDSTIIKEHLEWSKKHVAKHDEAIAKYMVTHDKLDNELKALSSNSSLAAKRIKLKINRRSNEMLEKHEHFIEDHKKLMKLVLEIKSLRKELESHEGHHH